MKIRMLLFIVVIMIKFLSSVYGDQIMVTYTLDATDLDYRAQLKNLKFFKSENAIKLNDMLLLEDDAPANGPPKGVKDNAWIEKLHKGIMIRKNIVLDDPRAFSGFIIFNGFEKEDNEEPLHISVNGEHFCRPPTKYAYPLAEHYYVIGKNNYLTDNWFVVEIPIGALKKGSNEFIMWAESDETSWEIVVASEKEYKRGSTKRLHHPNRSSKSIDGGKSWNFEKLGWKNSIDGEYAIRLSLDRFVPQGEYISPIIDIAEEWGKKSIKKLVTVKKCIASWDIDVPEGSQVEIAARFSESPVLSSKSWSPYKTIDGLKGVWINHGECFLQFKIVMKTENPLVTPSLKGLSIETTIEKIPIETNVFLRLIEFKNGQVIRPSVEFTHEDFMKLRKFRKRFELDKLVDGASTEFEAQLRLLRFAYEIPIDSFDPYNWDYINVPVLKKDKNGNIVRQTNYEGRRRDKHCLFSNFTLMGACIAMGYPARYVNLQTEGRKHAHEVMEVWSNDFNKWVFLDATRDYYYYDPETGIPMSLTEANERLAEIVPRKATWKDPIWKQIPDFSEAYKAHIAYREGNNKFLIKDINQGPHLLILKGQLHMVVRNDFASRPWLIPWRVSGHWGGNQFYGWYSDKFPRKREYKLNTNRWQDFNPPLNQSELILRETFKPGVLQINVDTVTPCFDTFLFSIDEGGWNENRTSSFEWILHEGVNRLRVKVRNTAGITGPESFVSLVMNN